MAEINRIKQPEEVFTPKELADRNKLDPSTIRKIFRDEPGVIRLNAERGTGRRKRRRSYATIRIPASVADRVFGRMTVAAIER
jgi:hypothetical protein